MISCFPDLNVWLALSVPGHVHGAEAWRWLRSLQEDRVTLVYSRQTQLGLLRLLTSSAAMGDGRLTLRQAWAVYDKWLGDPRVEFHSEPRQLDDSFRAITAALASQPASKAIGDCYLLAFAKLDSCALVTFDKALAALAHRNRCPWIVPGEGAS